MKKINVIMAGADSDYEDVNGQGTGTKWNFQENPILECILIQRKTLPGRVQGSTYDLYTVLHFHTKKEYIFFTNKVLEDRLKNIPVFSCVKISYLGKDSAKGYFKYSVGFNKKFIYNPAEWGRADQQYITPAGQDEAPKTQSTTPVDNSATLEDAPF